MSEQPKYWFNIKTKQVEKGLVSRSSDRIGPFDTEEQARQAEETVRQRSTKWREEDEKED